MHLEEERNYRNGPALPEPDRSLPQPLPYHRMKPGLKRLSRRRIAKHYLREARPLAGRHKFVRDVVRIDRRKAQLVQILRYERLAAGYPAGYGHAFHGLATSRHFMKNRNGCGRRGVHFTSFSNAPSSPARVSPSFT